MDMDLFKSTPSGYHSDDEEIWSSLPSSSTSAPLTTSVASLEILLKCQICKEWLRIPVSTKECHHTFCSECIRNSISADVRNSRRNGPACPTCKVPIDCRNLVPNVCVGGIVEAFKEVRRPLHSVLSAPAAAAAAAVLPVQPQQQPQQQPQVKGGGGGGGEGKRMSKRLLSKSPPPSQQQNDSDDDDANDDGDDEYGDDDDRDDDDNSTSSQDTIYLDSKTSLPSISTEADDEIEIFTPPQQRLSNRPLPLYNQLKPKDIKLLLQKDHLPTTGTAAEQKTRHMNFMRAYISECDVFGRVQRTVKEIAEGVVSKEKRINCEVTSENMRGIQSQKKNVLKLKDSRKSVGDVGYVQGVKAGECSSGDRAFDERFDEGFRGLKRLGLENKRKQEGKGKEKISGEGEEGSGLPLTSAITPPQDVATSSSNSSVSAAVTNQIVSNNTNTSSNKRQKSEIYDSPNVFAQPQPNPQTQTQPFVELPQAQPSIKQNNSRHVYGNVNNTPSTIGPWSCKTCTYKNERDVGRNAKCEMCMSPR